MWISRFCIPIKGQSLFSPAKIIATTEFPLITSLEILQHESELKQDENDEFRRYLDQCDSNEVDKLVHQLNEKITPQVNCLECGNCCRSLMINVEENELHAIADYLHTNTEDLKARHVETSLQGQMIMNTIPCAFLSGNACTVYEHRFSECREFPHLNRPHFTERLFGTLMHYGRCPIIYNVVEQLKNKLNFHI
jgi:Fe-S-cluster containining protein